MRILLIVAFLVAGCAVTPETVGECPELFETKAEIAKCEKRVLLHENTRIRREDEEFRRRNCVMPRFWDGRFCVDTPPRIYNF
jgi:hypothetical protein